MKPRFEIGDIVAIEMTVGAAYQSHCWMRIGGPTTGTGLWLTRDDLERYAEPIFVREPEVEPGARVRRTWDEDDASIGTVIAIEAEAALAWVRFGGFSAVYPFDELEVLA